MMALPPEKSMEIVEHDEAGLMTKRYVASGEGARLDIIAPRQSKPWVRQLLDVFLPAGYPSSVTEDYIHYQIYDSLQAFSSSIAGMLASRAVLEGVGVGDASASPTAALLLNVLQESTGRIATILFAHKLGSALEPECKTYRLAADIFNDTAMILECLSPAFPKPIRVAVLSLSSVLRSICGVFAGSSKASLSAHFARKGNLGEVNAKDSSQETVISLLGMLAGSLVVSWVSTPMATWSTLIGLLSIHLATNYAAVRAVSMCCLNRQRANIVFSTLLQDGVILTPQQVSKRERIFEYDGVLRWADDRLVGHCSIGVTLQSVLHSTGHGHALTGSLDIRAAKFPELLGIFADEMYILWAGVSGHDMSLLLKEGCTSIDQLKGWTHALLLAKARIGTLNKPDDDKNKNKAVLADQSLAEMRRTLQDVQRMFEQHTDALRQKGWMLDVAALETRASSRIIMTAG